MVNIKDEDKAILNKVKAEGINKQSEIHRNKILGGLYDNLNEDAKKLFLAMCLSKYIVEKEYYQTLLRMNSDLYKEIPFQYIKDDIQGFTRVNLYHEEYKKLIEENKYIIDTTKLDIIFSTFATLNRTLEDGETLSDEDVKLYFINILLRFILPEDTQITVNSIDDYITLIYACAA